MAAEMDSSESSEGIFEKFLQESNVTIVDVVAEKRKTFKRNLDSANSYLANSDYVNASKAYEEALSILKNDPNADEYEFMEGDLSVLKYLLCYSYLFSKTKIDSANKWIVNLNNVHGSFEALSEIVFCNERKSTAQISLMKGVFLLINSNEFGPEKWSDTTLIKPSVPHDLVLSQLEPFMKWSAQSSNESLLSNTTLKLDAPEFVPKSKSVKSQSVGVGAEKVNLSTKHCQTSVAVKAQQVQTEVVKCLNMQTQTKDSYTKDYGLINQKLDKLQGSVNSQASCMDSVFAKMQVDEKYYREKIKQLEMQLQQKDKVIESQAEKLSAESDRIRHMQKEYAAQSEKNHDLRINLQGKCNLLHSLLICVGEKYFGLQKIVIANNEIKCLNMLQCLKELVKESSATTNPSKEIFQTETFAWELQMKSIAQAKQLLHNINRTFLNQATQGAYADLTAHLEPVAQPFPRTDILHTTYLSNFRTNASANNINYWNRMRGSNVQTPPASPTPSTSKQPALRERELSDARVESESEEAVAPGDEWVVDEIAKLPLDIKDRGGPNYWRLIVHLKMWIPEETVFELADALEKVREARGGKLSGTSRSEIVAHVSRVLKQSREPAWSVRANKWDGAGQTNECAICFEVFDTHNSKNLLCKHTFHKDCIELWLRENSVCPICRKYSVSDQVFPPLL